MSLGCEVERNHQAGQNEADRAFTEACAGQGQGKGQTPPAPPFAGFVHTGETAQAGQDKKGQGRIDPGFPRHFDKQGRGEQQQRGQDADLTVGQPTAEQTGQADAQGREQGRRKAGCPFRHSPAQPGDAGTEPVQQGRFGRNCLAIAQRQHPVAAAQHLLHHQGFPPFHRPVDRPVAQLPQEGEAGQQRKQASQRHRRQAGQGAEKGGEHGRLGPIEGKNARQDFPLGLL